MIGHGLIGVAWSLVLVPLLSLSCNGVLFTTTSPASCSLAGCDPGFVRFGDMCYYTRATKSYTWFYYSSRCDQVGGIPVIVQNPDLYDFLRPIIVNALPDLGYWVYNKRMVWLYNNSDAMLLNVQSKYTSSSEPDQLPGSCLVFDDYKVQGKLFRDEDCDLPLPVVCKRSATDTGGTCAAGWQSYSDFCYIHHGSDNMTYAEAVEGCPASYPGATLPTLGTPAEMSFINNSFPAPFWTAYRHEENSTLWLWGDNSPLLYADWVDGVTPAWGECAYTDPLTGYWLAVDSCKLSFALMCMKDADTLSTAYSCQTFTTPYEDCICYWLSATANVTSFHGAQEACYEEGGIMAAAATDEIQIFIETSLALEPASAYWLGVSELYAEGVYRSLDNKAVTWTNWESGHPTGVAGEDCVSLAPAGPPRPWQSTDCHAALPVICQSVPDSDSLADCTVSNGCVSVPVTWWDVEDFIDKAYLSVSVPRVTLSPSYSLATCWRHCLNQTSFVCLSVNIDEDTYTCHLLDENQDTSAGVITTSNPWLHRTRRIIATNISHYCWEVVPGVHSWQDAVGECESLRGSPGWYLARPNDTDLNEALKTVAAGGTTVWLGLSDQTLESQWIWYDLAFPLWTSWAPDILASDTTKNCAYFDPADGLWYPDLCTQLHSAICMIHKDDILSRAPNVENAVMAILPEVDVVNYTCLTNYAILSENVTFMVVPSSCDDWQTLPNCSAVECEEPLPDANSSVMETGRRVGDIATYTCHHGYAFPSQPDLLFNVTCQLNSDEVTASWSTIPSCQAVECGTPPPLQDAVLSMVTTTWGSTANYTCNHGYLFADGSDLLTLVCDVNDTYPSVGFWNASGVIYECTGVTTDVTTLEVTTKDITTDVTTMELTTQDKTTDVTTMELTTEDITTGVTTMEFTTHDKTTDVTTMELTTEDKTTDVTTMEFTTQDKTTDVTTMELTTQDKTTDVTTMELTTHDKTTDVTTMELTTHDKTTDVTTMELTTQDKTTDVTTQAVTTQDKTTDVTTLAVSTQDKTTDVTTVATSIVQTETSQTPPVDETVTPPSGSTESSEFVDDTRTESRFCTKAPHIIHGVTSSQMVVLGVTHEYTCDCGFKFTEQGHARTIFCVGNAQWNAKVTDCQALAPRCPSLPSRDGATVYSMSTTFETVAIVMCPEGTLLDTGQPRTSLVCSSQRRWSMANYTCKERCPPLPYVEHADVTRLDNYVGGSAFFRCHHGYRFPDGRLHREIFCLTNFSWEDVDSCFQTTCSSLPPFENGELSTELAMFDTVVTATCDEGYILPDNVTSKTLICMIDSRWNDTYGNCTEVDCGVSPIVDNSARSGDGSTYNMTWTYVCDAGLRLDNGMVEDTIRCGPTGFWTWDSFTCGLGRCLPVPVLASATANTSLALRGTVASFTCRPGTVFLDGQVTHMATCDGESWGVDTNGCQVVYCPEVDVAHGSVNSTDTAFGAALTITCQPGFLYNGSQETLATCQANGNWSNMMEEGCLPLSCGHASAVANAQLKLPYSFDYLAEASYTCLTGFWFSRRVRHAVSRCSAAGVWTAVPHECLPVYCPALPLWDGMLVNVSDTTHTTVVNASCDVGLRFPDDAEYIISQCDNTGNWQPPIPGCEETSPPEPFEPEPEEASYSDKIGAVAVAMASTPFLLLALSDITIMLPYLLKCRRVRH